MRRFLTGILLALASLASAQYSVRLLAPSSFTPGTSTSLSALPSADARGLNVEVGIRMSPGAALSSLSSGSSAGGLLNTQSVTLVAYRWANYPGASRPQVSIYGTLSPSYVGPWTITAYIKLAGAANDIATDSRTVSIGQVPAPVQIVPEDGTIASAAPTFQVRSTTSTVIPVTYEIEMNDGAASRSIITPSASTGTNLTYYVPNDNGFKPGNYTWRARAIDANGTPGVWSGWFDLTCSGGIDIAGSVSQATLTSMKNAGWAYLFQAGWGGRSKWSSAKQNLINGRNAGLKLAAYAFLNFDNGSTIAGAPAIQDGFWQVDQGLSACGYVNTGNPVQDKANLGLDLKYFMIDIENVFWGTMSQGDRVQRIAEACQRARNLGFWPMIYARNQGTNTWWDDCTGFSTDFSDLPLWCSYPELASYLHKDHLALDSALPWTRFGGWIDRAGKQHLLSVSVFGATFDLNVWDPAAWNVTSPNPGLPSTAVQGVQVTRNANGTYQVNVTVRNSGSVEAYAVRIENLTLNALPLGSRLGLNSIGPGSSKIASASFPASAGSSGQPVLVSYTLATGMGRVSGSSAVVLP